VSSMYPRRLDSIQLQRQNHKKQQILLLFALFSLSFVKNVRTTVESQRTRKGPA
jgi:hypothetical protein